MQISRSPGNALKADPLQRDFMAPSTYHKQYMHPLPCRGYMNNGMADLTCIPRCIIPAVEHDRVQLDAERANVLVRAFQCHPAVLIFAGRDAGSDSRHNNRIAVACEMHRYVPEPPGVIELKDKE